MNVFLSSTAIDLREHRKALIDAIQRAGWQVTAVEHWGADARQSLAWGQPKETDRVNEDADADAILAGDHHGTAQPVHLPPPHVAGARATPSID